MANLSSSRKYREKRLSLLMHPLRREIYQLVCETPGSYFYEIVSLLASPQGTLSWHLRMLEKDGLIKSIKFGGKRLFFPNMLRSESAEKAFAILKNNTAAKVFDHIVNNAGCYQTEIAEKLEIHHDTVRHHITRLAEAELIEIIRDGRTVKYFPGELGKELINGSLNILTERYIRFLIDKLEEGCMTPEIVERDLTSMSLRIECPNTEDIFMKIELGPWETKTIEDDEEIENENGEVIEEK
ncbi:MAG: ArsR family transcriptional regulator [Candidatus Heimdallarchaeota archaeon]|nr:ArsR family transcriptional regulator [Candidatus Heimdallarchaeota archaeon]